MFRLKKEKEFFRRYGIPTPRGMLAETPEEASAIALDYEAKYGALPPDTGIEGAKEEPTIDFEAVIKSHLGGK